MVKQTVLIVDDDPANLAILTKILQPLFTVHAVNSGARCLTAVRRPQTPDLILLDVIMPGINGYEVITRLRSDPVTCDIPVIFVTSLDEEFDEEHGLELGAVDYLTKPVSPAIVLARVQTQLAVKGARDVLKNQNAFLEAEVSRRMAENQLIQDVSINALAHLAETRDPETGNHIRRTQEYIAVLAEQLQTHPRFASTLNARVIRLLTKSAPLHDIGKVGIPDHILLKPGKLSAEEWETMQTHAKLGADAIEQAEQEAERPVEFLSMAKEIAHWHHEKWDGSGYPDRLAGDAIPVSARLMALADVFDALISVRVYKPAMSYEEARDLIVAGRGKHFDPDVVDAFAANYENFVAIAERYAEDAED